MKDHYVKDYKEKELRQYILAYLLITAASIALHTDFSADNADLLNTLLKMTAMDIWVSGLSVLVVILNEIWSDAMKTRIVYGIMPSDTIFPRLQLEKTSFALTSMWQRRSINTFLRFHQTSRGQSGTSCCTPAEQPIAEMS